MRRRKMFWFLKAFRQEDLPGNYFRLQVGILRVFGIELFDEESALYKIYSKLALFVIVYLFTSCEAYEFYYQWGNVEGMVQILSYLLTHALGLIKVTQVYLNRKKIRKILRQLHEVPFAPSSERDWTHEKELIRNVIRTTEIQSVTLYVIVLILLISGIVSSLKARFFKNRDQWHYAFASMDAISTTESPQFEIACFYQIFCGITFAYIITSIDLLLGTILAHLSIQLKVLQHAFRNIKKAHALQNMEELGKYIGHHQKIFDLTDNMETLCNKMFLVIMVASVGVLCFILYRQSTFPIASMEFAQYFCYYWTVFCEIGCICYWGNEVTFQSEGVATAVVEADWVGAPLTFSKALVLIIARSQMTLEVTAGKFVPLSLKAFMAILKGSFSYYMILRQSQEKERH